MTIISKYWSILWTSNYCLQNIDKYVSLLKYTLLWFALEKYIFYIHNHAVRSYPNEHFSDP